jgi:hypothetical protein
MNTAKFSVNAYGGGPGLRFAATARDDVVARICDAPSTGLRPIAARRRSHRHVRRPGCAGRWEDALCRPESAPCLAGRRLCDGRGNQNVIAGMFVSGDW